MINSIRNLFRIELDPNRIFGLDVLRAFAILFVVIGHGKHLIPSKYDKFNQLFVFDGVSIFFVLSGFLIGGILIKSIDKNNFDKTLLINFWVRRWFRTLPNYFFILILLCVLQYLFTEGFTFYSVVNYFVFSQNLFYSHPTWFFTEAWSLSVEEWFYLITPLIIIFFIRVFRLNSKTTILVTALLLIILVTVFRYYRFTIVSLENNEEWGFLFRNQVITRLDSLMFGVIGAYLSYFNLNWFKYKKALLLIGLILMFLSKFVIKELTAFNGIYNCVFSFTIFSIATLFLLPYLSDLKKGRGIWYKLITQISLISYSMYLLNFSIIQKWIIPSIPWSHFSSNIVLITFIKYALYWILVFLLSTLLYKYFEIPMTNLRDKKNLLTRFVKK